MSTNQLLKQLLEQIGTGTNGDTKTFATMMYM